jgi:hypothetical protein
VGERSERKEKRLTEGRRQGERRKHWFDFKIQKQDFPKYLKSPKFSCSKKNHQEHNKHRKSYYRLFTTK